MAKTETVLEYLTSKGMQRRDFLKFCAVTASLLALPYGGRRLIAEALAASPRPVVIYDNFQKCTACTMTITKSFEQEIGLWGMMMEDPLTTGQSTTIEQLILDLIDLQYHETIMAPSGSGAIKSREDAINQNYGNYILLADGSVPLGNVAYSMGEGRSALDLLQQSAAGAKLIVALGTCAAFGGIPKANPNPTGAVSFRDLMQQGLIATRPLVNLSGCPPIPEVITGFLVYYLTYGTIPELDENLRPRIFYGGTVHHNCARHPFFHQHKFAETFDDEKARAGWCLFNLGCRGPMTFNACTNIKWNGKASYPTFTGHGCIGCSQPDFWDAFPSFYTRIGEPEHFMG